MSDAPLAPIESDEAATHEPDAGCIGDGNVNGNGESNGGAIGGS